MLYSLNVEQTGHLGYASGHGGVAINEGRIFAWETLEEI
ncbi:hypothetical protein NTGZN8_200008 [Candidatus Nitrotoga fabula]|uniref:Uncharacterized protein n=1 Tax=Candidatus Nitrotoga fabula TaxID=2182327 RepID=A0A916BE15_9PROT|nr:hypothetical protein NTGZN8_200008 [Candidatus Nitrotoga fabula]